MKKYRIFGLFALLFILAYIVGIVGYPLLEPDECRYVNMAKTMFQSKDYLTLYLNGDYFFEKPPLFFWIECLSFKFLGINEFSARLPIVLLTLLPLYLLFDISKRVKNAKFALCSSLILLTSAEYIIISRLAMLDSVLTSLVTTSILCYFYTFFVKKENKKYFWFLTYIFCALAVMAKGIPGVALPCLIIFISSFVFKSWKETLKYLPFGAILFLLIALPWHIIMLKTYDPLFFDEYIMKHHILRFLGSDVIDRKAPFYFYFFILLWGLFPYIFSFLADLFKKTKNLIKDKKIEIKLESDFDKFYMLNVIAALVVFIFFTSSGTKLITYILPIYPYLAVIIAKIWYKRKLKTLVLIAFLMALFSGTVTYPIFKIDYALGQDDLIKYAKMAKENNKTISTYETGKKYSLLYYSDLDKVEYAKNDYGWLNNELKKPDNYLIVKNDNIDNLPFKVEFVEKGIKYSIIREK